MNQYTTVTVDEDRCMGNEECHRLAPEAFEIDPDTGIATVLPGAGEVGLDRLSTAAAGCPVAAITVQQLEI